MWEKPEACEMQNASRIFDLMQYHDVDLTKWSWTNLHHGWSKKGHEIRIKTNSRTQCENMIVRKSWRKQDALHIPSTRLQTWTWRWCPKMLVRKAGSRRTDTQSRISATNIYILEMWFIWKHVCEKNLKHTRCNSHPAFSNLNNPVTLIWENDCEKICTMDDA